jgi:hypothetical protein
MGDGIGVPFSEGGRSPDQELIGIPVLALITPRSCHGRALPGP